MPVMYVVTNESLEKFNNHMRQEEGMSFNYELLFANLEDHINLLRLYPNCIIYISKSGDHHSILKISALIT